MSKIIKFFKSNVLFNQTQFNCKFHQSMLESKTKQVRKGSFVSNQHSRRWTLAATRSVSQSVWLRICKYSNANFHHFQQYEFYISHVFLKQSVVLFPKRLGSGRMFCRSKRQDAGLMMALDFTRWLYYNNLTKKASDNKQTRLKNGAGIRQKRHGSVQHFKK